MWNFEVGVVTEEQEQENHRAALRGIEEAKERAEAAKHMSPPLPSPGYRSNCCKEARADPRFKLWADAKHRGRLCAEWADSFNEMCRFVPPHPVDGFNYRLRSTTSQKIDHGSFKWVRGEPRWPRDGRHKHPLCRTYRAMWLRCYDPKNPAAKSYGERGIEMSPAWSAVETGFWNFVRDMGPRPSPEHSVDRVDVNGPYAKENCVWTTPKEQAWNRRSTVWVEFMGERLPFDVACKRAGFPRMTVCNRMRRRGMTFNEAVSTPPTCRQRCGDTNKFRARRYTYKGQELAASELAALAGCNRSTMRYRLNKSDMTPEEAVAMGKGLSPYECGLRSATKRATTTNQQGTTA
jgi:hypothetical protein